MTIYLVHVYQDTHTCPSDSQPHVVATRRQVLGVVDGGPCRTLVTIRIGDTKATIDCRRHLPADEQCPACRITVVEQAIITTQTGPATVGPAGVFGLAPNPCPICHQPLAAVLADLGHILCNSTTKDSRV